jgi:hypothetical protein
MILKRYKEGFALTLLCLSLSSVISSTAQATTHINPAIDRSYLGTGIDSASGELQGNCISGDRVETGNSAVNLALHNASSASQSIEEVKGSISADVNLGLFAAGASVSMHTRLEENSNTASFVYRVRYRAGTETLENRDTTALGLSVQGQAESQIRDVCGDEFIDSVELGSDLYLVTQMQFSSKAEYEKFVTEIRVRVLFWSRTDTISSETYAHAANGVYSVKAVSTVALPGAITTILGGSGEKYCHVASNDMPSCVAAANDVLDYLIGSNSSYRSYLEDTNNLTVIGFNSMPYDKAGHFELATGSLSILPALEGLQNQLMTALTDNRVKQNITKAYGAVISSQQADYQGLLAQINDNILVLEAALDDCRNTPVVDSCQIVTDNALAQLIAVDVDI